MNHRVAPLSRGIPRESSTRKQKPKYNIPWILSHIVNCTTRGFKEWKGISFNVFTYIYNTGTQEVIDISPSIKILCVIEYGGDTCGSVVRNHKTRHMCLLPFMKNWGLRVRWECRERFLHHRGLAIPTCTCVTHVPWCMPGSLTICLLWSRGLRKRSQHSPCMHKPEFYVSGKRPMAPSSCIVFKIVISYSIDFPFINSTLSWSLLCL